MLSSGTLASARIFRPLGFIFVAVLAAALFVIGGSAPRAAAADDGVITGTVTLGAGVPSAAMQDVVVSASPMNGPGTYGMAQPDPVTGDYTIEGLSTTAYRVEFYTVPTGPTGPAANLIRQYFDGTSSRMSATPVAVTAGSTTSDIDATLALGGSINGTITLPAGAPAEWLQGVGVMALPIAMGGDSYSGTVDASGAYTIQGLPSDDYRVSFYPMSYWDQATGTSKPAPNLVTELYDDSHDYNDITPVTVVAGSPVNGIDAALAEGGAITGTVTIPAGMPASTLSGVRVSATPIDHMGPGGFTSVDPVTGAYRIEGLLGGNFRLQFTVSSYWDDPTQTQVPAPNLVAEYFQDTTDYDEATPVAVAPGDVTAGIDAALAKGASITGTVTLPAGMPSSALRAVQVLASGTTPGASLFTTGSIDPATGAYEVRGLSAGTYQVQFQPYQAWDPETNQPISTPNVIAEYYDDAIDPADATPLTLAEGQARAGINATLAKGAVISGTVSLPAHTTNATMSAVSVATHSYVNTGADVTVSNGAFRLERLLPGDYYLVVNTTTVVDEQLSYGSQYAKKSGTSSYKVSVTSAGITGLQLVAAPYDATISGTLTTSGFPSAAPAETYLADAVVYQKLDSGWVPLPNDRRESTQTNGATPYSIPGLTAGTYTVGFEKSQTPYSATASLSEQWWQNKTSLASADAITLSGGQTRTGVDGSVKPTTTAPPTGFADVSGTPGSPTYSAFATEIAWMSTQGISTGYDIGGGKKEYRPFGTVTRDAMAAFLYRAAGSPTFTAPAVSPFTDVTPTSPFYKEIAWMALEGISTGYDIGGGKKEFRPFANITRDAMAAFLYRAAGSPAFTAPAVSPFTDVTPTSPFYKEITWMVSQNISTGWDVGAGKKEFRPFANITRDAMAAFLYRYAHLA